MASSRSLALFLVYLGQVAVSAHTVKQKYFTQADCKGEAKETDGISGDKQCIVGGVMPEKLQSEDILCDPDNKAMHVTLYSDTQCSNSSVYDTFSYASGSCHSDPKLGGSFSWSCSDGKPGVLGMPTYPEIPNASLNPPYFDQGCYDRNSAIEKCARHVEDVAKGPNKFCAGFFFIDDPSCGSGKQLYKFKTEFNPIPGLPPTADAEAISFASVTPTAIQMVFAIQPNHRLDLPEARPGVKYGTYTMPAEDCANDTGCFAYQFQCPVGTDCEKEEGKFPKDHLIFLLYEDAGKVGHYLDNLRNEPGQNVFGKTRQKKLPSQAALSTDNSKLLV